MVELRQSIARTATEATTGRYADPTAHLSGRIGTAMLSQKAIDDIGFQREQLSLRETRLEVAQTSLTAVNNRVKGIDVNMLDAIGTGNVFSQTLAARDAAAALDDVFAALNVRFGERFLFSGDATDTPPLTNASDLLDDVRQLAIAAASPADFTTALDTYFNTPGSGWQPDIYRGTLTASDSDAVTAADPALVELISNLAILAISDPGNSPPLVAQDAGLIRSAAGALSNSLTSLTTLRSERGVFQEQIRTQKETLDVEETIFTSAFNALTARDQYDAASALKQLEATLEASYLLTSRLSGLSLINFLR
jgi:flagellar hook-associated protein 3 FlgL